jgi:predicted nucleic acid-binding protein
MVLVDANVLLDIATRDPVWFTWSSARLLEVQAREVAAINPIIYTELIPVYSTVEELDRVLVPPDRFHRLSLPYAAAAPAARAFRSYCIAGGVKTSPLPDFFIGAHAECEGLTLLTRDAARYQTYFRAVKLICPPRAVP